MRSGRRLALALGGGVALAAVLGALLLGLEQAIPPLRSADALAVRALDRLEHAGLAGSVEQLDGAAVRARCDEPTKLQAVVHLADGRRFVLLRGPLARRRARPTERAWAAIQLAGCRGLLAEELASLLVTGAPSYSGRVRFRGRAALRFVVSRQRGTTSLLVDPATLAPLGLAFAGRQARGTSALVAASSR